MASLAVLHEDAGGLLGVQEENGKAGEEYETGQVGVSSSVNAIT
jgi:hypothetical protein